MGAISKGNAMDVGFISEVILPVVFVIVGIALVWAIVELVLVLRRTRKTVETLETSVKPIIDDVQKVAADAKEMTASIKPAIDRVDPLVERASLAVDAANLEIMRLDGILENVDAITSSAASATEAVDTVANAPLKIVNAASEKLREARYSYSDAEVKRYFTQNAVFAGLFRMVETLFGIEIEEKRASVWHPDVKYFEVKREGKLIAAFYADLYAREGKRSGAWMDGERTRRRLPDGKLVTPVAYLVTNFAAPVEGREATMTHDEVTTLFHEFGHTLHHILTAQEEAQVSGINGVEWDAVELPSQFLENFAWEHDVVKAISRHADTGESLPDELFSKMIAAKNFEAGAFCVRQVEFALFDMLLHSEFNPKTDSVPALLDQVRKEVAVVFPPKWNRFPQSFGHIFAGGYAAGYYSYKWAEVLSADCFSAFEEEGVLNPKTGRRFLTEILERGSSRDAIDNFVAFRGRKPELDALLRLSGIVDAPEAAEKN